MIEAPARHALRGGSGGAPARRRSARYGAEMLLVPGDRAVEEIGDMLGLAHAVALARITQHDRLDADVAPRDAIFLVLGRVDEQVGVAVPEHDRRLDLRSEEHTSDLQSLMRISYADF